MVPEKPWHGLNGSCIPACKLLLTRGLGVMMQRQIMQRRWQPRRRSCARGARLASARALQGCIPVAGPRKGLPPHPCRHAPRRAAARTKLSWLPLETTLHMHMNRTGLGSGPGETSHSGRASAARRAPSAPVRHHRGCLDPVHAGCIVTQSNDCRDVVIAVLQRSSTAASQPDECRPAISDAIPSKVVCGASLLMVVHRLCRAAPHLVP